MNTEGLEGATKSPGTSSVAVLIGVTLLNQGLFSGLIFGWGALQLLLEREGVYSELCDGDDDEQCSARRSRFALLFTIGVLVGTWGSIVSGVIVDKFGSQGALVLAGLGVSLGLLQFALAGDGVAADVLIPGVIMLSFGAQLNAISSYPASFLVHPTWQGLYISSSNCLFDASSIWFLVLLELHLSFGTSRRELFLACAALAGLVFAGNALAWRPQLLHRLRTHHLQRQQHHHGQSEVEDAGDEEGNALTTEQSLSGQAETPTSTEPLPLPLRPFHEQLRSREFLFVAVFAGIHLAKTNFYLGANKDILEDYGDGNHNYVYTRLFTALLPASIVCVPCISWFMHHRGFPSSFRFVNALGIVQFAVVLVPSLKVQVVAFCCFTVYRAFFFSLLGSFVAAVFGPRSVGRLFALCIIAGGVTQPTLFLFTYHGFDGDILPAIWALTVLSVVLAVVTEGVVPRFDAVHATNQRDQQAGGEAAQPSGADAENKEDIPLHLEMAPTPTQQQ